MSTRSFGVIWLLAGLIGGSGGAQAAMASDARIDAEAARIEARVAQGRESAVRRELAARFESLTGSRQSAQELVDGLRGGKPIRISAAGSKAADTIRPVGKALSYGEAFRVLTMASDALVRKGQKGRAGAKALEFELAAAFDAYSASDVRSESIAHPKMPTTPGGTAAPNRVPAPQESLGGGAASSGQGSTSNKSIVGVPMAPINPGPANPAGVPVDAAVRPTPVTPGADQIVIPARPADQIVIPARPANQIVIPPRPPTNQIVIPARP